MIRLFSCDVAMLKLANRTSSHGPATTVRMIVGIKGKVLLTINDHPKLRKLFAAFKYERAAVSYTVGGAKRTTRARALIYRSWR